MLSIITGVLAAVLQPYLWIGIAALLLLILALVTDEKYILPAVIIAFLVITSDISEGLRIIINIAAYIILIYKYIKEFGISLNKSNEVPRIVKNFIIYTLIVLVFSSLFSVNILTGIIEVLRTTVFFILMYIFYSFIKSAKEIKLYIDALLTAGVIIAITILYFFFTTHSAITDLEVEGLVHEGGYYHNVAAAGGIFAITISINTAILFLSEFRKKGKIIINVIALLVQIAALLLTNSRAAFLAVFFSTTFILITLDRKLFKKIFYSVSGISILIIAIFPRIIDILGVFFRANRVLENTRYYMWDIAFGIIKNNPIWGSGPGMFKLYIYKYMPVMLGSWTESQIRWIYNEAGTGESHNYLLYKFSETGIMGLISAIALPIIFFYLASKVLHEVRANRKWYILMISIIGSGIGLIARSFFESTGLLTDGWITRDLPYWILLIIIIYLYQNLVVLKKNINELEHR